MTAKAFCAPLIGHGKNCVTSCTPAVDKAAKDMMATKHATAMLGMYEECWIQRAQATVFLIRLQTTKHL
jgi:hypothetical protein